MSDCIAVMDLGTNTFHLMIAEVINGSFTEIAHDHEAVKLGEGGINKGYIQPNAFERGVNTMQRFSTQIKQHQVKQVKAIATSALRSASNGQAFISAVKEQTGIDIEIIDGNKEAEYIYEGVKASGASLSGTSLLMDIGGGSVEFIICTPQCMVWKQSFEIGAARLIDYFHQIDPIPADSILALCQYLDEKLQPLTNALKQHTVNKLIGSAGAFETFVDVIEMARLTHFNIKNVKTYDFNYTDLTQVTNLLISSSKQQRTAIKGIIPLRVDMIVVASILTRFIMDKFNITNVGMSTYSLKEGVMVGLAGA